MGFQGWKMTIEDEECGARGLIRRAEGTIEREGDDEGAREFFSKTYLRCKFFLVVG
jgi:hypothetical protein